MPRSRALQLNQSPLLAWCALLVIVSVVLGTLVPFSFDRPIGDANEWYGLGRISWVAAPSSDVVANILVYLPVGALLWLTSGRLIRQPVLRLAAISVVGLGMSVSLEWLQTLMSARCASWLDVALNVAGTLIGTTGGVVAGVFHRPIRDWARTAVERDTLTAAVVGLTIGYVVYALVPFDFVTDTESLRRSLGQSHIHLFAASESSLEDPSAAWIAWAGQGGRFALLGFVMVLSHRRRRIGLVEALWSSVGHVLILAALIEVMQISVLSHAFDLRDWLACGVGGTLGVGAAACMWRMRRVCSLPAGLAVILAGQVAYILAVSASPFDFTGGSNDVWQWLAVPFSSYAVRPFGAAVGDLIELIVTFAVLAAVLRALLSVRGPFSSGMIAMATVVGVSAVATSCEVLKMLSATRHADITDVLIATAAAVTVATWPIKRVPVPRRTPEPERAALTGAKSMSPTG